MIVEQNGMAGSNITVETLDALTPSDIGEIGIEIIAQLDAELDLMERTLKRRRAALRSGILQKYGPCQIGTKTTHDGEYVVKICAPKRVDWDQSALASLWKTIGDTAAEYIKIKYDVSEAAYKSWPKVIRKEFEPARTVKPGATTVTIVKKEAA